MKKINFPIVNLIILVVLLSSCSKWEDLAEPIDNQQNTNQEIATFKDVKAPNNFDWKTVKDIEIKINGSTDGIVEAASSLGVCYQKAYLAKNQTYTMKLTIPTCETSIRLKFNGQDVRLELSGNNLNYQF